MTQAKIMYWNLGGLDRGRLERAGTSYAGLIASVMQTCGATLAGFSGVFAGQGNALGTQVVEQLDHVAGAPTWNQQASPPLGQGRDEQYLFVWNLHAVEACKPEGLDYCLWQYPLPGAEHGECYGFPRPERYSPDLPPFTMFFKLGATDKCMPVAILHAPEWNLGHPDGFGIFCALRSFCAVGTFDLGNGTLLMGTFNVPVDDNVAAPDSNGARVFGELAGQQGKYDQGMNNGRTLLGPTPEVAIASEDAYLQTSDNFFLRRDSSQGGITGSAVEILPVIEASIGTLSAEGEWQSARLPGALAQVEEVSTGAPPAAGADGSYNRFDDAFAGYRLHVSDHLPITMILDF